MAEQATEAKDFDSIADKILNEGAESSTAEENVSRETSDPATAEVDKTDQVKEVESDTSLSVEAKLAKVKEILGDDERALDAYIKQKGYHKDPAWQKQREIIEKLQKEGKASGLSDEDKSALDEFKKFRSSPEYIKTSMKSQGYTDEAINKKLQDSGHNVDVRPEDDVNMVIKKLNINLDNMAEEDRIGVRNNINDVVKIADVLIRDRLEKILPQELGSVRKTIDEINAEKSSNQYYSKFKSVVDKDAILDFTKDIEPSLHKFMDENPGCNLQDIDAHFSEFYRNTVIDRLRTGKKQEERNEMKSNQRQNIPLSGSKPANLKKTGNFEKDADAFLDSVNI